MNELAGLLEVNLTRSRKTSDANAQKTRSAGSNVKQNPELSARAESSGFIFKSAQAYFAAAFLAVSQRAVKPAAS